MNWPAVLAASAACYGLKLAGLSLPASVLERPRVRRIAALLPVALLAALIAIQTFGTGKSLEVDARLVGLTVAVLAVWRRAPFLAVVVLAAAATALVRLVA